MRHKRLLQTYQLGDTRIDSLDLKALVVTRGVKINREVYMRFGDTHRLNPNPERCNCFILPDGTIVQLTDLAFHMQYLRAAIILEALCHPRTALHMRTPFSLEVSSEGRPILCYQNQFITEVSFPPASRFYQQSTSNGLPFTGNAVLQGMDFLSFQCLWPCEYARAGQACHFCYAGGMTEKRVRQRAEEPADPTPRDVAEITAYAVLEEQSARHLQITGGSTLSAQAECRRIAGYLAEIDRVVGLMRIPGEILVYTTPPQDPCELNRLFDAGAHRVACSLEVWDEARAQIITPGKIAFAGRQRFIDCLSYIANKYGPNHACSSFVVGLEPVESLLAGAEFLAQRGIVPIASLWIPFGRPVMSVYEAPGLDYYRQVKDGLASIFARHGIEPPGSDGLNVCLCRDVWKNREELHAPSERACTTSVTC